MRVALTGTPGTGKTSASEALAERHGVIHLNDLIREEGLWTDRDADRDSLVADLDAVAAHVDELVTESGIGEEDRPVLIESHLAHYLDVDRVVVLRCRPGELERRLLDRDGSSNTAENVESTGEAESKRSPRALARFARENAESEALDVILSEAVERHGLERVYEIDTTDRTIAAVAAEIEAVLADEREPSAGTVDFVEYLQP